MAKPKSPTNPRNAGRRRVCANPYTATFTVDRREWDRWLMLCDVSGQSASFRIRRLIAFELAAAAAAKTGGVQ